MGYLSFFLYGLYGWVAESGLLLRSWKWTDGFDSHPILSTLHSILLCTVLTWWLGEAVNTLPFHGSMQRFESASHYFLFGHLCLCLRLGARNDDTRSSQLLTELFITGIGALVAH